MSCVCPECATPVSKGYLTRHLQTEKCRLLAERNAKFRYVCRDCNATIEKLSQTSSHVCGALYVDPEIQTLRVKNQVLEQLLAALGINLNPVPSPLPRVEVIWNTPSESSEDSTESSEEETPGEESPGQESSGSGEIIAALTEYINEPDEKSKPVITSRPVKNAPREKMARETTSQLEVDQKEVTKIINELFKGEKNSPEGEDNYYLLGSKLGELVARFVQNPSGVIKTVVFAQKLKLGSALIDQYQNFISGLKDSGCSHTTTNCVLHLLELYQDLYLDWHPDQLVTTPSLNNLQEICSAFQLPFTFLPLEHFVQLLKNVYVKVQTGKGTYDYQYYRKEGEKWVLDPFLQDLSQHVSACITEKSIAIFRGLYKNCFGDNVYRREWAKAPRIEPYRLIFKNIEICANIFDFYLLVDSRLSIVPTVQCQEKVSMNALDQFQLLSTRVHLGAPAYELSNFYERVFEENTQGHLAEDTAKWHTKYLKGIKAHSSKFSMHKRFKAQVEEELREEK